MEPHNGDNSEDNDVVMEPQHQRLQHAEEAIDTTLTTASLQSVLDSLDAHDREQLVDRLLRFHFQEEQFNWKLIREAGWTFDVALGAYRAPPITTTTTTTTTSLQLQPTQQQPNNDNQDSNHCPHQDPNLPPLILTATELYEYLDLFAVSTIRSFLDVEQKQQQLQQKPHNNKCFAMSNLEIQRGRALREQIILMKFLQERNDKCNNQENLNNKSQSEIESTRTTDKNKQTTTRISTIPTAKRQTRSSVVMKSSDPNPPSVTVIESGADMFFKKNKVLYRGKGKGATAKAPLNDAVPLSQLPSALECAKMVAEMTLSPESTAELQAIEDSYASSFLEWKFLLTTNHSLLLHGFGSKQKLLNRFVTEQLKEEGDVLSILGFDCEITIESLLDVIVIAFLDGNEPTPTTGGRKRQRPLGDTTVSTTTPTNYCCFPLDTHPIVFRAICIADALASKAATTLQPNILVIHNIDGVPLRSSVAQEALAALVTNSIITSTGLRGLWLVASMDHVDSATLLWNTASRTKFAWIWQVVHTYQPHINEVAMMDQYDEGSGGDCGKKNKSHKQDTASAANEVELLASDVLKAVSFRHVEVLQVLAGLQLNLQAAVVASSTSQKQNEQWVDFVTLREECIRKCMVSSDAQLRSYLGELYDHCLVVEQSQQQRGRGGCGNTLRVRIPYSEQRLREILALKKKEKKDGSHKPN